MNRYLTASAIGIALLVGLLVAGVLWGTALTQQGVEQAIGRNFTAAGKLAQVQVAGEKMRRFEKETFIYVGVADKRAGYVKEFDSTYAQLLTLLDDALAPSNRAFDDAERAEILRWKLAANFYAGEFYTAARRGGELALAVTTPEQRAALTIETNDRIKAGKDRFRELLSGAEKMREAKEQRSQRIAGELQPTFSRLRLGTLIAGLGVIAAALWMLRTHSRSRSLANAAAAGLPAARRA